MKIVFITPKLTCFGSHKMCAWVANQIIRQGHDVHFVTFFSEEKDVMLNKKINFFHLGNRQSKSRLIRNTIGMLGVLWNLDKYIKKEKPDILVSFLDSVGYTYLPIATKRCKVVISERVDPHACKGVVSTIKIWLMKFADVAVFQTEGAREFFKGKYNIYEKSVVIPNPVVLTDEVKALRGRIPKFEERDNRIVTVGRLSLNQKRQDVLLRAFDIVHKKHPELELVIYGDGEDKEKIREMIIQMGLNNCVTLAGKVLGIEEKILNAKAFVLTSDYEGIPNALIEALSIGLPCVSTDCSPGGARLLIDNCESGIIVPCGDANGVAEGLFKIIENKEFSNKISAYSCKMLKMFSEDNVANMWAKCFEEQNIRRGNTW